LVQGSDTASMQEPLYNNHQTLFTRWGRLHKSNNAENSLCK